MTGRELFGNYDPPTAPGPFLHAEGCRFLYPKVAYNYGLLYTKAVHIVH